MLIIDRNDLWPLVLTLKESQSERTVFTITSDLCSPVLLLMIYSRDVLLTLIRFINFINDSHTEN